LLDIFLAPPEAIVDEAAPGHEDPVEGVFGDLRQALGAIELVGGVGGSVNGLGLGQIAVLIEGLVRDHRRAAAGGGGEAGVLVEDVASGITREVTGSHEGMANLNIRPRPFYGE